MKRTEGQSAIADARGFTLIELLIVMAIMGIMASIIAGSFLGATQKARDSERKSNISQLQKSLEAYYNDNNKYPTSNGGKIVVGLNTLAWGTAFSVTDANNNTTVYMSQLPNDSKQPTIQYYYNAGSGANAGKSYQIYTHLENSFDNQLNNNLNSVTCGGSPCNYGVSSPNATMATPLP
jgi:type II secretion system protein G